MSYSMSQNLSHKQAQSLKQTQRLIMSPQMQQAINLLQMPVLELSTMVSAEIEQNPILEYSSGDIDSGKEIESEVAEYREESESPVEKEVDFDNDNDFEIMKQLDEEFKDHFAESANPLRKRTKEDEKLQAFMESSIQEKRTLFEYLMKQASEVFESEKDMALAEAIIGNLDERGYLEVPLIEIALLNQMDEKDLQNILYDIQDFDPKGIGARTLQESLLIQLTSLGKGGSLAYQIVEKHYDDMLHNRVPVIKKSLGCSADEIREAVEEEVAKLDLNPGAAFSTQVVQHITSDVKVVHEGGKLSVEVNSDDLPPLRINSRYMQMLEDETVPLETKDYIKQKISSGKWLLRNIHQRNETLTRIASVLIEKQKDYFSHPQGKLSPLTMKTVAQELELHESTIARAVANKYIDCPRGLMPLRSFFTNAYQTSQGDDISSRTVKDELLTLVRDEDKLKPLSDEALSAKLKDKGIACARRTVAKYRRELNIGNTSQRKQHK